MLACTLFRRGTYYLAFKLLASLLLIVNAATIQSVIVQPRQSIIGGAFKIDPNLRGGDRGFSKASSGQTALGISCSSPVIFGVGTTANTAITASHIVYDIQLNTTSGGPASTCYTVILTITPSSGSPTNSTVFVQTGASVPADQAIDCKFDVGVSLPASPYSFRVLV